MVEKIMQWSAESVWVSMFPPPGENPEPYVLFSECFGVAPDLVQPLEGVPNGKKVAKTFGEESFFLLVRPGRIDIAVEPVPDAERVGHLPDKDRALSRIVEVSERALGQIPVHRLSCIVNLMQLLPDQQKSAVAFSEATGIANVDNNTQDLIFQRNTVDSNAGHIGFNQIERWATTSVYFMQMSLTSGEPPTPQVGKQWFQVTKTLDYNTFPQQSPLATSDATSALRELVDRVRSTMSKG